MYTHRRLLAYIVNRRAAAQEIEDFGREDTYVHQQDVAAAEAS